MVILWLLAALAAEPVTWEGLPDQALAAWADGPGAGALEQVDAARSAARRAPLGPHAVRAEIQYGIADQRQVLTAASMPLGLGVLERRFGAAQADLAQASADEERWVWVMAVQDAWLTWWTAAELSEHLDAYADDVEAGLLGFEAAVEEGLLAPLALEDLRAESAQVRSEAVAVEQQAAMAESRVRAFLGDRTLDAGDHHLHNVDQAVANPWPPLVHRAREHPAVRRVEAEGRSEGRRARALSAARTPSVEAGPMWAPDASGSMKPLLFAGIEVPLQPGVSGAQRQARGAQAAAESEARWRARWVEAELQAEAEAFDATVHRLERLHRQVLGPLEARQRRLEAAFADGLVTADRVVRARQERHEAEHEQVEVAGELLASVARAQAMAQLLEETR